MHLRSTCTSLLFFLPLFFFAQKKLYTTIQSTKKNYPEKNFYISAVQDKRSNTENIGYVFKIDKNFQHPADFKKGIETEVLDFLQATFPNSQAENKILLKLNRFEIGHIVTEKRLDTGFVIIDCDLYRLRNDSGFHLYNYSFRFSEASETVALSHGNRMKRALFLALNKVDSSLIKKNLPFAFDLRSDSANITINELEGKHYNKHKRDSINRSIAYPSPIFVMLGANLNYSINNLLLEGQVNLLFRLNKNKKILIGFNTNYLAMGGYNVSHLPKSIKYNAIAFDIGFKLLHHIHKNIFFNINPQFIFGQEHYTIDMSYYNSYQSNPKYITFKEFLYGMQVDFGIYRIPKNFMGLYYGADFFLRGTSGDIYDTGIGIKLNLGFKF